MSEFTYLANQLLVSTPSIADSYFEKSVIYVCEHSEHGAMGLVVNHPMSITVADLLIHMEIIADHKAEADLPLVVNQLVLAGGPMQRERGFVIHRPAGKWQSSFVMPENLTITTSRDILQALVTHEAPEQLFIALGYTGWDAGQLEEELAHNAWINCPVDFNLLFSTPPEQRWALAGKLLGIDLLSLPNSCGHA